MRASFSCVPRNSRRFKGDKLAVLYNLNPLETMALFCDGEKRGVWSGGFIKNEKKRGLVLPTMLREFLKNYGYLGIIAHTAAPRRG